MVAVPLKVTSTKKKGEYEIRSYAVKKLQNLGQGATLTKLLQLLDFVGAPLMDEGEALGYFNGTQKFRVAFKDDKPVAVHMKGETEDDEVFNKKFGKKGVFGKTGGGFQEGERVTLKGLQKRADLNGKFGFVDSTLPTGRIRVRIGDTTVDVLPANLEGDAQDEDTSRPLTMEEQASWAKVVEHGKKKVLFSIPAGADRVKMGNDAVDQYIKSLPKDPATIREKINEFENYPNNANMIKKMGVWYTKAEWDELMNEPAPKPAPPPSPSSNYAADSAWSARFGGSRLDVKGGRTKRNRRGHKRGQTRKLAARRR